MSSLKYLNVSGCERITDAGLAPLRALTSLQRLFVCGPEGITDAGLAHLLPALTSLQQLAVYRCHQIPETGLMYVAATASLQVYPAALRAPHV